MLRSKLSKKEQACSLFVKRVQAIEMVQEVRCTEEEDCVTAWTITRGPAFDYASNQPIYEAALEVMRSLKQPVFDFRIVNINEIQDGSVEDILPSQAKVIWKQKNA